MVEVEITARPGSYHNESLISYLKSYVKVSERVIIGLLCNPILNPRLNKNICFLMNGHEYVKVQ